MKPLVFTRPAQVLHNGHRYVCFPPAGRRQPMENRLA
jgi:hypothetical protein